MSVEVLNYDDNNSAKSDKVIISESELVDQIYFDKFRENFICRLCFNIILSPKMCNLCETTFCKQCINKRKKENGICPVVNSDKVSYHKIEISDINKTLYKIYEKLKVRCQYYDEVSILEYKKHKKQCNENSKNVVNCFNCDRLTAKSLVKYKDIDIIKSNNIKFKFENFHEVNNKSNLNNKLKWFNEIINLKNKISDLNLQINIVEKDLHSKFS